MKSIKNWPAPSREAACRVIEQYGEPDEISDTQLVWHKRGPWRQIIASKAIDQRNFPAPHYTLFALGPSEEEGILASLAKVAKRKSRKSQTLRKLPTAATTSSAA
jgi:hypothetical protein